MKDFNNLIDDVASRCIGLRTLCTARAITRHYDHALRSTGITITQFTLIVTIARMAPESISQIAELLYMERTSVSRNLKLLEKQELIRRGDVKEARKRPVALTTKGQKILREAYVCWNEAQSAIEDHLAPEDLGTMSQMLRNLRESC